MCSWVGTATTHISSCLPPLSGGGPCWCFALLITPCYAPMRRFPTLAGGELPGLQLGAPWALRHPLRATGSVEKWRTPKIGAMLLSRLPGMLDTALQDAVRPEEIRERGHRASRRSATRRAEPSR
jgi:hypothetical protein